MAAICFILFKVGFDLESLSMCMYAYLLYIISQYWVRLRYLSGLESSSGSGLHSYFFLPGTSATCSQFSICEPKDQSVQSAKCAPGSIVALFSNI